MKVKFYGTRGSIAVSGKEYAEFGGSTSCVRVVLDNGATIFLDAGTGILRAGSSSHPSSLSPLEGFAAW